MLAIGIFSVNYFQLYLVLLLKKYTEKVFVSVGRKYTPKGKHGNYLAIIKYVSSKWHGS